MGEPLREGIKLCDHLHCSSKCMQERATVGMGTAIGATAPWSNSRCFQHLSSRCRLRKFFSLGARFIFLARHERTGGESWWLRLQCYSECLCSWPSLGIST